MTEKRNSCKRKQCRCEAKKYFWDKNKSILTEIKIKIVPFSLKKRNKVIQILEQRYKIERNTEIIKKFDKSK